MIVPEENPPKEASSLASYVAHILFVIAQSYFGALLVLMIVPLIRFLSSTEFTLEALWSSFPAVWVLAPKGVGEMFAIGIVAFPIGLAASEFLYFAERKIGLHNDLNPRDTSADASLNGRENELRLKCRIQGTPAYSRVYEWENFQAAFFLRMEYLSHVCFLFYSMALVVVFFRSEPSMNSDRQWGLALIVLALLIVSLMVARQARISKYESLSLATKAIEDMLNESTASTRLTPEAERGA